MCACRRITDTFVRFGIEVRVYSLTRADVKSTQYTVEHIGMFSPQNIERTARHINIDTDTH